LRAKLDEIIPVSAIAMQEDNERLGFARFGLQSWPVNFCHVA
jgi:hypothetical protein